MADLSFGFAELGSKNADYKNSISWEVGISEKTVYYEISRENMEKALRSDKDAYEVMIYAETVPFTEIERYKLLISKCPNKEFREILEIRYNKFVGKKQ